MPNPKFSRGTNISHWLSQSEKRGSDRTRFFTREDVQRIADWGFDHIRLPIDEVQMWPNDARPDVQGDEAFDLLESALDWCDQAGLGAIVDLHILRSHHFNDVGEPALYTDPREAGRFAALWVQLSKRLRRRDEAKVAYELMNEPVAKDPADWNRVAHQAYRAVRDLEPKRTILLGSNRWNSCDTFDVLEIPPDDDRLILTFHFYNPMLVTHYTASWWRDGKDYTGPIQYPGKPIPDDALAALSPEMRSRIERFNIPYDKAAMLRHMSQPLAAQQRTGLNLYCGEFGCLAACPQAIRHRWYRDLISLFTEQKIGWGNWDYRGSFGIVGKDGESTGIAEVMLAAAGGTN